MIKNLLLLVMLSIGFSLTASAGVLSLPGVSFASADAVTNVAGTPAKMPTTAIRQTALDNLPNNDGRAPDVASNKSPISVNVSCNQHQPLRAHIALIGFAITDPTDKRTQRSWQFSPINEPSSRMTARLEAPPSNL